MNALAPEDRRWLDAAVRLARGRLGTTGQFPAAGVLIVDGSGQFLAGRGVTGPMGRPAALAAALADARGRTGGSTAYLTIEPDASEGPYESEAEKLVDAGVARVVVGAADPHRKGNGVGFLARHGMDVAVVDHDPSHRLIEAYRTRLRRKRPFCTAILAISADGMVAGPGGAPVDLLTRAARRWVIARRATSDVLLTSARAFSSGALPEVETGLPLVLVSSEPSPREVDGVIVVTSAGNTVDADSDRTVAVAERNGRLDLRAAAANLAERGINALQLEAGARLTEAMISAELIDRFHLLDSTVEIGRGGVPATPLGALDARLRAAGFTLADERLVGECRLRSFDRTL